MTLALYFLCSRSRDAAVLLLTGQTLRRLPRLLRRHLTIIPTVEIGGVNVRFVTQVYGRTA
jgi:hypothetical protein